MVAKLTKAQISARPEQVTETELRKLAGLLRQHDPDVPPDAARDTAKTALGFCRQVGLRGTDSVTGVAFLMHVYGHQVFAKDPAAAPIADATRPEAERKTLIHAELLRLEKAS